MKATFGVEVDSVAHANEILSLLDAGMIAKEALVELLGMKARGLTIDLSRFKTISDDELRTGLSDIVAKNPKASVQALMGEAMKQWRGKVDGKRIMNLLQKIVS